MLVLKKRNNGITMLSDFVARHIGSDFGEDLRIDNGRPEGLAAIGDRGGCKILYNLLSFHFRSPIRNNPLA